MPNRLLPQPPSFTWLLLIVLIAMLLAGAVGCQQEVDTSYLPPPAFDKSLNGISVFGNMATKRGHAVRTEMVINAYAKNCDVLVWFSRNTGSPKAETVTQLEDWLAAKPGRTFVYIGRAFESTADYWAAVENAAPTEEDRREVSIRKSEAESKLRSFLGKSNAQAAAKKADKQSEPENPFLIFDDDSDDEDVFFQRIWQNTITVWFETSPRERQYKVTAISGAAEWTQAIDVGKLQLTCFEDWNFADDIEPLLVVDGEAVKDQTLVARKKVGESQAIFVTHAGFLLNYPLVNHEHRKLAGRLIDTFGTPKKKTCIYIGNREINFDRPDTSEEAPFLLRLLHIWPLSVILCHVIVLCSAFCFYKWPIFGRPRKIEEPSVTDFGKHIDAYAELLAEAKDDNYTLKQITDAYNTPKSDSSFS